MITSEIEYEMYGTDCYLGTFPKDKVPQKRYDLRPLGMIVNTDPARFPGQHWVALFIDEDNRAEYFDSFGRQPICCEIQSFLAINDIHNLSYNKYEIQSIFSIKCGVFCILYLKMRCKGYTFRQFIDQFSSNLLYNDVIVEYNRTRV
jgi:hypothetical protein